MGLLYFILAMVAHMLGGAWWQFAAALAAACTVDLVYILFAGVERDVITRAEAADIYDIEEWKREKQQREEEA